MPQDFDVDDHLQSDAQKIRRLNQQGVRDLSGGAIIEGILWCLMGVSGLGMMVAMPWVGPDKVIPGEVWLGYSLASILLFMVLALLVRWVRHTGDAIDDGMTRRFRAERGR